MIWRLVPSLIVLGALGGVVLWVLGLIESRDAAEAEAARLRSDKAVLEQARDQALEARAVARAHADRVAAERVKNSKLIEEILRNGSDADLPADLRDAVNGVRGINSTDSD